MKKKLLVLAMIGIMVFALTSCGGLLGKWRITEVTAGDITMTEQDVSDMGIDAGYLKINKSGGCKLNILGDEYDGVWTESEDGSITVTYGDNMQAEGNVSGEVMTLTDAQGSVYTLVK